MIELRWPHDEKPDRDGSLAASESRTLALAGNPNTGKSTLFNRLTGLRQHTGNWPGKTVKRAEGAFAHAGRSYRVIDLPGTYSLLSSSTDEEVARDYLLFGKPDCTIVVVDATALERNLNLVFQVMEITDHVVLCVNLIDEARRKGIEVNVERLSSDLGIPAVATVARNGRGVRDLLDTVADVIEGRRETAPKVCPPPAALQSAVDELQTLVEDHIPGIPNARWIAYRLLEGDHQIRQALLNGHLASVVDRVRMDGKTTPFARQEVRS